jgi:predicted AAA+ superfamily ATPase
MCSVPIYSHSHKEQDRNYKKVYCIDWALAIRNSLVWDGSFSRALENAVYLHLRRSFSRVFYYLTKTKRQEVDFIALGSRGDPVMAVQVCSDISDPITLEREVGPLEATAEHLGLRHAVVVTLNEERELKRGSVRIQFTPAWKWLTARKQ